jgi:hypothetical protein
LWAQVDTDDTVNECPFENNNVLGPISLTVSGSTNVGGLNELPQQTGPNEEPRHTPTSEADLPSTIPQPMATVVASSTRTPTPTLTFTPLPPGKD